jgi:FKBP-type peptidyl-prolyl cis-trans isomerase FklB
MTKAYALALLALSTSLTIACQPADSAADGSVMNGVGDAQANTGGASSTPSPAPSTDMATNLKEANDFLAANKTKSGIQTTASGLQYAVIASGPADGPKPTESSVVQVNYEGKLLNGTVFDSSFARGQAAEFPVGRLIPAWVEALQLMRPGDEWTIWVPPGIGYGEMGTPDGSIPPNSLLIFRMRLEKIISSPDSDIGVKADKGATR